MLYTNQPALDQLRHLTPESLVRQLEAFHAGHLRPAARTWEAIEGRDDALASVVFKRKVAAAREGFEIHPEDDSPEALQHAEALESCFRHATAVHALDQNETGGMNLLLRQMMDAVGKRYAVHELVWKSLPSSQDRYTFEARFVPLWFFENRTGRLRFLENDHSFEGQPLEVGAWMVTVGPGLMEACSVAYLYKHTPLRDWLLYCERNGMPGVRGVTDALPGSPEWDAARDAVEAFGAEFRALFGRGTEIEPIDLSTRGDLPYPALVERMDRAMTVLWRGADLSTFSRPGGVGASVQADEASLIADADAAMLSEALHASITVPLCERAFGEAPRARLTVRAGRTRDPHEALKLLAQAQALGLPIEPAMIRAALRLTASA